MTYIILLAIDEIYEGRITVKESCIVLLSYVEVEKNDSFLYMTKRLVNYMDATRSTKLQHLFYL